MEGLVLRACHQVRPSVTHPRRIISRHLALTIATCVRCRKVGEGRYAPTTREIRFRLYRVVADGTYTLRVSLAAAHMSRLQVRVNGRGGGGAAELTTPEFGGGNAIARHGIHGVQWNFQFPIRGYLLREGDNSVSITQTRADGEFLGVLYDYVRLEAPPAHCRDPTATATTWRT